MELTHTVSNDDAESAKEVDIKKFDNVEVEPAWLSSSTVVDSSVIVAPWRGNFTVARFDNNQLSL